MKLLVVVDYQNDFVDGALGFEGAKKIEDRLSDKIEKHIKSGGIVMLTMDTHDEKSYLHTREGKQLPVKHCILGSKGHDLHGKIGDLFDKYKEDYVVYKTAKRTFGLDVGHGFGSDRSILDIATEIEICGVVTNMCVLAVAVSIQNIAWNKPIAIDASCCASFSEMLHDSALNIMESMQMKVINREVSND